MAFLTGLPGHPVIHHLPPWDNEKAGKRLRKLQAPRDPPGTGTAQPPTPTRGLRQSPAGACAVTMRGRRHSRRGQPVARTAVSTRSGRQGLTHMNTFNALKAKGTDQVECFSINKNVTLYPIM